MTKSMLSIMFFVVLLLWIAAAVSGAIVLAKEQDPMQSGITDLVKAANEKAAACFENGFQTGRLQEVMTISETPPNDRRWKMIAANREVCK